MSFLGARVRSARQQKGLTQAAFAELVGVTQATISRWESGAQAPNGVDERHILKILPELGGEPLMALAVFVQRSLLPIALYSDDFSPLAVSVPFQQFHGFTQDALTVEGGKRYRYLFDRLTDLLERPNTFFSGNLFALEHVGRVAFGRTPGGSPLRYHRSRLVPYWPTPNRPVFLIESEYLSAAEIPESGETVDVIFHDETRQRVFPLGPRDVLPGSNAPPESS